MKNTPEATRLFNLTPKTLIFSGVLVTLLSILLIYMLPLETQRTMLREHGIIENLTVATYIAAIVVFMSRMGRDAIKKNWEIPAIFLICALRELDFDKIFFTVGLLKSRQYTSSLVPLEERLLSAIILLVLITIVARFLLKYVTIFGRGLCNCAPRCIAVLVALLLLFSTKAADGIGRKLGNFGFAISESFENFAFIFEEVGEWGIAIMFMIATILGSGHMANKQQEP